MFIAGLACWQVLEHRRLDQLSRQSAKEQGDFVTRIADLKSASLTDLVEDYTIWDDMCTFAQKPDKTWGVVNLDQAIGTFDTDSCWVFNAQMHQVYGCDPTSHKLLKCPVSASDLRCQFSMTKNPHFYCNTSIGLVELAARPINRSDDRARRGKTFGYFVVGRLWNSDAVTTFSGLTGAHASITNASRSASPVTCRPAGDGIVVYTRQLTDVRGVPIRALKVVIDSRSQRLLMQTNVRTVVLVVAFTLFLLSVLFICLLKWVSIPLQAVLSALRTKRVQDLRNLEKSSSDFGELARLVHDFFEQRAALLEEIIERTRVETELAAARDELEERVAARTSQLEEAYDCTIEGWSKALDLRDQETEGHCLRVSEMTLKLIRSSSTYFHRPSVATISAPSPSSALNASGFATPRPTNGLRDWLAVRSYHSPASTSHAPESPTLAP
jgi:hypothetical protein